MTFLPLPLRRGMLFLEREGFERDAPLPALSIESVRRAWRHFVLPTRGWANMGAPYPPSYCGGAGTAPHGPPRCIMNHSFGGRDGDRPRDDQPLRLPRGLRR